ncbi:hypothetical protein ACHAPA_012011 [Fusarium lateritium]
MPKAKLKNIPNMTELRQNLGFGISHDRQSINFERIMKDFLQKYRSADGTAGSRFVDWHNQTHNQELKNMTEEFLVRRGPQFWPDSGGTVSSRGPTWTKDSKSPAVAPRIHNEASEVVEITDHPNDQSDYGVLSSMEDVTSHESDSPSPNPVLSNIDNTVGHRAAPVAQMTESQDMTALAEATVGVLNGTHTLSGRKRRPVDRQDFVNTVEFVAEDGSEARLLVPTEQTDAGPRVSPELGTPSWEIPQSEDLRNSPTIPESVFSEEPHPSTEDAALSREELDARTMPPPPLPLPQSPARVAPKRPRISIKYRIQKSPGVFRVWDPPDTFTSLSMDELQTMYGYQDVESVQFILQHRGMSWDDLVLKDDNVAFQDMKFRFQDKI